MLLEVRDLAVSFRGLRAVSEASFSVAEGEIVALIGPNGAGKTTCFNVIAGVVAPESGSVMFAGRRLDGLRPDQVCRAGIGRTFQLVKPFGELTVAENVVVGALHNAASMAEARAVAVEILERLGLASRSDEPAHRLTLPEHKRLEVARALATRPRLLLLDEVMAGLTPAETDRMVAALRQINAETGLAILLIEHVMRAVMALATRIVVLHHGEVIAEGAPAAVVQDARVLECYLGEEAL